VDEPGLLDLAERQYGLLDATQAACFGLDDKALGWRVTTGRLQRVHPAVYRVSGSPTSREQSLLAACLAAGPGAAVSHRSAAHEWQLAEFPDVVEIVTPRATWPRLAGVRVHRSHDLRPDHTTYRRRVPITKPLRTLVDLGQSAPWAVPDALDRGLASKLFSFAAVDAALHDFSRRGRTGVGILRKVVEQRALGRDVPESLLEAKMARLLQAHGLPQPTYQYWVTPKFRVDFAYVGWKVVIEVDGFGSRSTAEAMDSDLSRQNELVLLGWTVLRFTWMQVVKQPEKVAKAILVTLSPLGKGSA
jgi:very-short-patch-repair endonuclease